MVSGIASPAATWFSASPCASGVYPVEACLDGRAGSPVAGPAPDAVRGDVHPRRMPAVAHPLRARRRRLAGGADPPARAGTGRGSIARTKSSPHRCRRPPSDSAGSTEETVGSGDSSGCTGAASSPSSPTCLNSPAKGRSRATGGRQLTSRTRSVSSGLELQASPRRTGSPPGPTQPDRRSAVPVQRPAPGSVAADRRSRWMGTPRTPIPPAGPGARPGVAPARPPGPRASPERWRSPAVRPVAPPERARTERPMPGGNPGRPRQDAQSCDPGYHTGASCSTRRAGWITPMHVDPSTVGRSGAAPRATARRQPRGS